VALARAAYSKALHLAPHMASAWGDAAAGQTALAHLSKAHPCTEGAHVRDLRRRAERLLKGKSFFGRTGLIVLRTAA